MDYTYQFQLNDTQLYVYSPSSGLELKSGSADKKGNIVFKKQKYIANFIPLLIAMARLDANGEISQQVKIVVQFADGSQSKPVILPLKGLEKVDWSNDIDLRCVLNPDVPKVKSHVANVIRLQCATENVAIETMTLVNQLGGHYVEGVPVFHTGNELIWPSNLENKNKPQVKFEPVSNVRLAVDPHCSERDADAGMARIVDLSPDAGRAILALNLMCVQWDAFEAAGITPRCNMYLHGPTGAKKTTYAAFTTQLYNRDKPLERPDRLNASIPAAVKLMNRVRHGVLVLDDLYPADSSEIRRQQEKTLLEITRIIADGTEPARVRGGQVTKNPPRCGILGTGEYYIGGGSDAVRLFPIEIKTPIDCDKLTVCQSEPLMLSTFYRYYIEWYITNFNEIVELLKEWKGVYLAQAKNVIGHDRLKETQFCLEAAYRLYLTYRSEKGFISGDACSEIYESFYHQLNAIVIEQNERAKQRKGGLSAHQTHYLSIIRSAFHQNQFRLVNNPYHFRKGVHDGVVHKDEIYFRQDKLMDKIRMHEPDAIFKDVLLELKQSQALTSGDQTAKQLHGAGKGLRFYAIKLCKLH